MYWIWLLIGFVGRIRRSEYALGHFLLGLIGGALSAVHVAGAPAGLVVVVPSLALVAKRLHDLGLSMVLGIVPLAAWAGILALTWDHGPRLHYEIEGMPQPSDAPILGLAAVGILFGLWLALARGDPRPNAYGERLARA